MNRFLQLNRKIVAPRRLLHFFKQNELDEPAYFKKPVDQNAIALMKKFENDILYSSYIETNKKSLSFKKRTELWQNIQKRDYFQLLEEARTSLPSVLIDKFRSENTIPQTPLPSNNDENSENNCETEKVETDAERSHRIAMARSKLKLLTELGIRRSVLDFEAKSFPDNWMEDYETFNEDENTAVLPESHYGTPDPSIPITNVPCHGCGSNLQCADTSLPGYLPSEIIRGQHHSVLRTMICQRCHFLKNYNTSLKVKVDADDYVKLISRIKDEYALAILMLDVTDFPGSIWPNIIDIIGTKRPVIVVGNKVDLLPQDSRNYLEHITACLEQSLIEFGFAKANIKRTCLISARTNYGIENLITSLHELWRNNGDVYLMGNANVGKSTLFNALLKSDYCKLRARDLIRRATSSLWPGTTLKMLKFPIARPSSALLYQRRQRLREQEQHSKPYWRQQAIYTGSSPDTTIMEHLGQTFEVLKESKYESEIELTDMPTKEKYFNEKHKWFQNNKWLYDTPGVIQDEQTINMLTSEELLLTIPKEALWPRVFYVQPGNTIFISGLGRIDYLAGSPRIRLAVFASRNLTTLVVNTDKADEIYEECLGSEILNVPRGNEQRLKQWPNLIRCEEKISVSNYYDTESKSVCDIVLSSAGWVSVNIPVSETAHLYAWTPDRRGIFVRKPSLLPYAATLYRGKRMKFTPAYSQKEPNQVSY